jgi:hypothetical protein
MDVLKGLATWCRASPHLNALALRLNALFDAALEQSGGHCNLSDYIRSADAEFNPGDPPDDRVPFWEGDREKIADLFHQARRKEFDIWSWDVDAHSILVLNEEFQVIHISKFKGPLAYSLLLYLHHDQTENPNPRDIGQFHVYSQDFSTLLRLMRDLLLQSSPEMQDYDLRLKEWLEWGEAVWSIFGTDEVRPRP